MGKTLRRCAIDNITEEMIEEHREKLRKIGLVDKRLLSDNKVMKFICEKAKRNTKIIPLEEILLILQR